MSVQTKKRFQTGRLMAGREALHSIGMDEILAAFYRHAQGDWGEVSQTGQRNNDYAVQHGLRIVSAYRSKQGRKFWIITEEDRSATNVLLPEEY